MPRRRSRRRFNRRAGGALVLAALLVALLLIAGSGGLGGVNIPRLPNTGDRPEVGVPDLPLPTFAAPTIDLNLPTLEAGLATLLPDLAASTPSPPASGREAAACVPANTAIENGIVTGVVDGDTIKVEIDGREFSVRYIGIDTPETTRERQYFGPEAAERNRQLVEGQAVRLVKDVSDTDRFSRLLRYVFAGDTFVNYELVAQGFATAVTFPPDVACAGTFRAAERAAREGRLGLWAGAPPAP